MNEWCEVFLLEEMQMRFTCSLHSNMWDFPSRGKENDKPDQSCTDRDIWIWIFILIKILKFQNQTWGSVLAVSKSSWLQTSHTSSFQMETVKLLSNYYETVKLWNCETWKLWSNYCETVKLWNCETLKMWNSDQMVLNTCIQVVPHFGGVTTQMSPSRTFPVKGWKGIGAFYPSPRITLFIMFFTQSNAHTPM